MKYVVCWHADLHDMEIIRCSFSSKKRAMNELVYLKKFNVKMKLNSNYKNYGGFWYIILED